MLHYALVFVASGIGGVLRHGLSLALQSRWGPTFPIGTLVVNVSGCLGIGFCAAAFSALQVREEYRIAVLVGIFGGYTTFSSFGRETIALFNEGQWARAGLYVLLSNVLGLLAVWLGAVVAKQVYGTGAP